MKRYSGGQRAQMGKRRQRVSEEASEGEGGGRGWGERGREREEVR